MSAVRTVEPSSPSNVGSSNKSLPYREDVSVRITALRRMSSERLMQQVHRDLTAEEMELINKVAQEIVQLQDSPPNWLGNFVKIMRRRLGNPTDVLVDAVVVPPAYDILRRLDERRSEFLKKFESLQEEEKNVMTLRDILSINDAIEGSLRFLLGHRLVDAKALLLTGLRLYPDDLRLYKMFAYVTVYDRTLNWRTVQLQQSLFLFDRIQNPDAEIWALRGDIGESLWRVKKEDLSLAEQAIVCYMQSFRLSQTDPSCLLRSLAYGVQRAALLSSELFGLEKSRTSVVHQRMSLVYRQQALDHLRILRDSLTEWKTKNPEIICSDYYFNYNVLFACLGLKQYKDATQAGKGLAAELKHEKSTDDLAEENTMIELKGLVQITVFNGVGLPKIDEPQHNWHEAWKIIAEAYSSGSRRVRLTREVLASTLRGRIGLSLSGGGLRAVFMHLGLLARLAECGILGSLDSISTVSGGSIIGALLYQKTKELLDSKDENEITKNDYIELVRSMIAIMGKATEQDIYASCLKNPFTNLSVQFGGRKRISVLADWLHRLIYSYGRPGHAAIRLGTKDDIRMRDMKINVKNWAWQTEFKPRVHNWRRTFKAPALYLNCTNLNTGHLWRFCITYMGEKADMHGSDLGINSNTILESIRYEDAHEREHRNIAYAECVAVSQLYPGVFDPYEIRNLYPGMTVKLVDGGVFDSSGLNSLFHANTDYVITNEMSQVLPDVNNPSDNPIDVVLRIIDIASDLNFERVLRTLKDRLQNFGVRDVCFIHARQVETLTVAEKEAQFFNRRLRPKTRTLHKKEAIARLLTSKQNAANADASDNKDSVQLQNLPKHVRSATVSSEDSTYSDEITERLLLSRDNLFPRHSSVKLGHCIKAHIIDFRTSLDSLTECERNMLMAFGYSLADGALRSTQKCALMGGQFASIADVVDTRNLLPRDAKEDNSPDAKSISDEELLQSLLQIHGCEEKQWGFFDVDAPSEKNWAFSSMLQLIEESYNVKIPKKYYDNFASLDTEKIAYSIRDKLDITEVTDDPALANMFVQAKLSRTQLAVNRAIQYSSGVAFIFFLLAFLLASGIAALIYFIRSDSSSNCEVESICLLEQLWFYVAAIAAFIFLFIRPGWVTRFVFAVFIQPLYYFLSSSIADRVLQGHFQEATFLQLREKYWLKKNK